MDTEQPGTALEMCDVAPELAPHAREDPMATSRALCAVFWLGLLGGCGDNDETPGDAGGERADAATDAGIDGAPDAALDASLDAAVDASMPQGWECVGSVDWPEAPNASVDATWRFSDYRADGAWPPFEGLLLEVCAAGTDCAVPLDTSTTDADGEVVVTLPTPGSGFDGYVRSSAADYVTTHFFFRPPIADGSSRWLQPDWEPAVLSQGDFAQLADAFLLTLDMEKGRVITTTTDCEGTFTDAVVVTIDGETADAAGADSLFFNVDPGDIEVDATLDGTLVARVQAFVIAGAATAVHFGPTPVE